LDENHEKIKFIDEYRDAQAAQKYAQAISAMTTKSLNFW